MWCTRMKANYMKYLKRTLSNSQMESTSASVASGSKFGTASHSEEAAPTSIHVRKYIDSDTTVVAKPHETLLSFEDIPGPRTLFLISKFWNSISILESNKAMVSFIQNFLSGANFFHNILCWGGNKPLLTKFFHVYGPVVRLHGAFHSDVVLLTRPEHARHIFQQEDPYPIRSCLECIEKYRLDCEKYDQAGLFFIYGNNWNTLRETVNQPPLTGADDNYEQVNKISDKFIQRIMMKRNKLEEVGEDFDTEIYRWYLECLFTVTLKSKIGFLDCTQEENTSSQKEASDATTFLHALKDSLKIIEKCENGFHLWKFVKTPSWRSLVENCDTMDTLLNKYVDKAVQSILDKKEQDGIPFLQSLMANQKISRSEIMTILMDTILVGTAATTHTIAFLLYYLSKNKRCQRKLREEIHSKKIPGNLVSKQDIEQMSYLHACIKEVLRLSPAVPILSRISTADVKIMDYTIPKNTRILFASHLNSQRDEYFEEAKKFKPERWTKGDPEQNNFFATMPFGHGPKAYVAKQFAENQIAVLLYKICRSFQIEYDYGDIESSHKLLASPTKPLKFRFINK